MFYMLKQLHIPGINSTWSRFINLFIQCSWEILVWFSFLLISSLVLTSDQYLLHEMNYKMPPSIIWEDSCIIDIFFVLCLIKFTSKVMWIWSFFVEKYFNYKFNFFTKYRAIQILSSYADCDNLCFKKLYNFI